MNSEAILQSDLLDILFEKRNKDYGAYILRKFYPQRVKTSLCIMFGIVLLFSAFTFLPGGKEVNSPLLVDSVVVRSIQLDKEVKKPAAPRHHSIQSTQRIFTARYIIKQETDSMNMHSPEDAAAGTAGVSNSPTGDLSGPLTAEPVSPVAPLPPAPPETGDEGPVYDADVPPSFPGGEKELRRFLEKNLVSPRELEEGEMIEVRIKCVVGFGGNLQSFEIAKDGGELFNNEVIRVLKKMPKWNPGKKGNRNVPVYFTIPVKFVPLE